MISLSTDRKEKPFHAGIRSYKNHFTWIIMINLSMYMKNYFKKRLTFYVAIRRSKKNILYKSSSMILGYYVAVFSPLLISVKDKIILKRRKIKITSKKHTPGRQE